MAATKPPKIFKRPKLCLVCQNKWYADKLCEAHYRKWLRAKKANKTVSAIIFDDWVLNQRNR